jgi:hypothetical protein
MANEGGRFLSDFGLQEEGGSGQTVKRVGEEQVNISKVECEWWWELSVRDGRRVAQ